MQNWLPVGLLYAFLYMGRYNLTVAKGVFEDMTNAAGETLMTNADFGTIFAVGTGVYGTAFVINGPLTDRLGGRKALLIGGAGAAVANLAMGLVAYWKVTDDLIVVLSVLYAVNMYFQSFGAVSIVKINAPWFHVRERGGVRGDLRHPDLPRDLLRVRHRRDDRRCAPGAVGVLRPGRGCSPWPGSRSRSSARNTPGEAGHLDFDTADDTEDGMGPG